MKFLLFMFVFGLCGSSGLVFSEEVVQIEDSEDYGLKWGEEPLVQGFIAKDLKSWVGDFKYVELVLFDYGADPGKPLVYEGEVHKGLSKKWTKRLNAKETERLEDLVTGRKEPERSLNGGFCHEPHHGFIFYGKNDEILGFIEVCFMCHSVISDPYEGLSSPWDFAGIRSFIEDMGLPTAGNRETWAEFFAKSK